MVRAGTHLPWELQSVGLILCARSISSAAARHGGDSQRRMSANESFLRSPIRTVTRSSGTNQVKAISMDMRDADASLLRAIIDDADNKVVFDRFHIDAVDKARRRGSRGRSKESLASCGNSGVARLASDGGTRGPLERSASR